MSEYLVRRVGKMLFPHLARDQRRHLLFIMFLVMMTSVSTCYLLVSWMMSGRH